MVEKDEEIMHEVVLQVTACYNYFAGFDFPGTLVASQSMTSQSSLLASVQDGPSRMHLYHLVRHTQ